jgi:hypothetical protein
MVFALAIAPGYVLAGGDGQSCATPEALVPGYQYGSNTQNDGNPILAVGAIPSPANDHIYSFTATDPDGFINVIWATYDFAVYLVSECTEPTTPSPIAYVTGIAPAVLAFSGLVVGQTYYVIVSGDPNAGTGPSAYGGYGLYMPIPSAGGDDGGLSCASPQELLPGRTYTGNTLKSSNFIGSIGAFASPANDEVYSITRDVGGFYGFLYVDSADYDFGVFVTNSCGGSSGTPLAVVTGSAPAILDLSTLTAGQTYYLIVSGDPNADFNDNGEYSLSTLPPPEVIFSDGFDGRGN